MNCIRRKKTIKVLTIKQPWATLIMQGYKRFEFRSWQMDNVQVFKETIETKGHLSLWEYNIEK